MRVTPKSEDELKQEQQEAERKRLDLLEPGLADFLVTEANDKTSHAGNDMIEMQVQLWDKNGKTKTVKFWLLDAMPMHLRQFCYATGLGHNYESGNVVAADCVQKGGKCVIDNKKEKDRETKEWRGPYTKIMEFVVSNRVKETENYQTSKTNGMGAVAQAQACKDAKAKFKAMNPTVSQDALPTAWRVAVDQYFGPRTEQAALSAEQWKRFAADGFTKAQSPVGDEAQFADSDIPF